MCHSVGVIDRDTQLWFLGGVPRFLAPGLFTMAGADTSHAPDRSELDNTVVLLQRYRAGDLHARERLFERYVPILTHWARCRSPRARRDVSISCDDLVQETFIRALEKLDGFEPRREGAFLAYLHSIFVNLVRDEWRKSQRRPDQGELSENIEGPERSPIDAAISTETLERFWAALARLNEAQREAVILRIDFGYTFEEVAAATGAASADAARKVVARALPRIAQLMSEYHP